MENNKIYKTFETYNERILSFKKHVDSIFKYFSNNKSQWDEADILSEITDVVSDYHLNTNELKNIISDDKNNPYNKYLRKIYKAMLHDEEFGQFED